MGLLPHCYNDAQLALGESNLEIKVNPISFDGEVAYLDYVRDLRKVRMIPLNHANHASNGGVSITVVIQYKSIYGDVYRWFDLFQPSSASPSHDFNPWH